MAAAQGKQITRFDQKLKLVRSVASVPSNALPTNAVVKKKINIPICDVRVDPDYESIVSASFQLPQSYLRHVRRIGDEADVSVDCNVDQDDKMWLSKAKFASEKELRFLTYDAFETIINIFERHTGLSRDPIPQSHADRLVSEALKWTPTLTARLLPEVYSYWLRKRERMRKPLCRKYWPQTPAADNNPHNTFRPRDKERYRLRKQQRKNDIDSFRKMQQLRREFSHAHVLLELIIEREQLKRAASDLRRELFEQAAYDLQAAAAAGPGGGAVARPPRRAVPFRHELQFEHHLLKAQEPDPSFRVGGDGGAGGAGGGAAGGRDKASQQSSRSQAQTAAALQKQQAEAEARRLKRQASSLRRKREDASGGGAGAGGARGAERGGAGGDGHHYTDTWDSVHPNVPGPPVFMRGIWMPFCFSLPTSEQAGLPRTVSDYLDELELRPDQPLPCKFRSRMRLARGGRLVVDRVPVYPPAPPAHNPHALEPPPDALGSGAGAGAGAGAGSGAGFEAQQVLAPSERIFTGTYVYPTVFNSRLLRGNSGGMGMGMGMGTAAGSGAAAMGGPGAGPGGGGGGGGAGGLMDMAGMGMGPGGGMGMGMGGAGAGGFRPGSAGDAVKAPHRQLFALPPTQPPERAFVTASLLHRQRDVFTFSDSEDEWVDLEAAPRIARPRQRPYAVLRV